MKAHFGTTLTQFNLMAQLDRAPGGIRMGELSRRTMVTGSNVTVVIDDLVRRGLAERRAEPHDRRAISITLTPAGQDAFARMAPQHEGWISEMFESLPGVRKREIMKGLDELKAALRMTLRNSL
jgi:DNA-binding MarR family transcriptional regulator